MQNLFPAVRRAWERAALSRRMVVLMVALLAAGLTISGGLMLGILREHLVGQVDRQLREGANQLALTVRGADLDAGRALAPSDYYVFAQIYGSESVEFLTSATEAKAGNPDVSALLAKVEESNTATALPPVTVHSSVLGSKWRAYALPLTLEGRTSPVGALIVALPLQGVFETLRNTAISFMLVGAVLVILAAVAGQFLVRRSLAPLRDIESVAGAIAEGDLSQRIPDAPPTTEVGSLSSSLNKMLGQIESSFEIQRDSERRMRRFVSDASHELRTPLAAIRGYAELYRIGAVDADGVTDAMRRIEAESTRMGALVEDLLTLARLDEGPSQKRANVDLVQVANETRSDLQALDPSREVSVQSLTGESPPQMLDVVADRNQIVQVFMNLAGNITRYTPKGSPVEIRLGAEGNSARIEFIDHGPGIQSEDRPRVFERFFRTDRSRSRDQGGSGLGLSIVTAIITGHGGNVELTETRPHGLTVLVTLPSGRGSMGSH